MLFDQNLSPNLAHQLEDVFPGSTHVRNVSLRDAPDSAIWNYAILYGLIVVTKDADFYDRSIVARVNPKIIWIRLGNCSTRQVETLLRWRRQQIAAFASNPDNSALALP